MKHRFFSPTEMVIQKGAVEAYGQKICSFGKKAMLVTTKNAARITGALKDVESVLKEGNIPYEIFSEVEQNPSYNTVSKAADFAAKAGCDFFIGIGGGSAMDAAKAVSLLCANPEISEEDAFLINLSHDPYPVICVGTTAGTGSEVTEYSVITQTNGKKRTIGTEKLFPVLSLGDITYIKKMSANVLKSTAIDAMCHAFESYFNKKADCFSDTFAIEALKLIIPEFETISAYGTDGLDDLDFENLYLASILSGYAIATTGTALCHGLSYYLSENFSVPHGFACGVFLPAFLMHNSKWAKDKSARLYDELCRTEDEIKALASDLNEAPEITFTENDFKALRPRLENNKSLEKCLGECSPEYAEKILKALFM